ncbi:MAG TPA: superoxide dismutase family protein [Thermoanaerobaculia bacterium]|nr:superoxide dismutase family protein [Thermoanaerobaculia bacterium]
MKKLALIPTALFLFAACAHTKMPMAVATLQPLGSSTGHGNVHFQQQKEGVEVTVDLTGLAPNSTHGFHVHDKGSCADFGNAAGPHYNPTNAPHAAPDAASHHAGDFGNVIADANGEVHTSFMTHSISVGGMNDVIGHAVILHANPDDLTSQPAGNAGPRIACGVVEAMAGEMHHM